MSDGRSAPWRAQERHVIASSLSSALATPSCNCPRRAPRRHDAHGRRKNRADVRKCQSDGLKKQMSMRRETLHAGGAVLIGVAIVTAAALSMRSRRGVRCCKTDENATRNYLNNYVSHAHALSRIALSMLALPLARGGSSVRERRAAENSGGDFPALCARR